MSGLEWAAGLIFIWSQYLVQTGLDLALQPELTVNLISFGLNLPCARIMCVHDYVWMQYFKNKEEIYYLYWEGEQDPLVEVCGRGKSEATKYLLLVRDEGTERWLEKNFLWLEMLEYKLSDIITGDLYVNVILRLNNVVSFLSLPQEHCFPALAIPSPWLPL